MDKEPEETERRVDGREERANSEEERGCRDLGRAWWYDHTWVTLRGGLAHMLGERFGSRVEVDGGEEVGSENDAHA